MEIALGIAVLIAAAAAGVTIPWMRRWRELSAIEQWEPLDDESIYARFYASSGRPKGAVLELWHEVADTLRLPSAKLRPSDRFGTEVGRYWIISARLDALAVKAETRAKRLGVSVDLHVLSTADDYIKRFLERDAGS